MSAPLSSSTAPITAPAGGLPAINQALEPAWVRRGSPSTQKAYESALAFEDTLVEQLAKSLTAAISPSEESEGGEAGSSEEGNPQLSSMLPQSLAAGIMHAGGLGMAAQMTRELEGVQAGAHVQASGGTTGGTGGA